jgi:hypothetical protein
MRSLGLALVILAIRGGVVIDKRGNKLANCNASGSCSPPR